jgi:predicted acylesterase/phospholipase RssA
MAQTLEEGEMAYDVVSGISVGSINGLGLSMFDKG